MINSRQKGHGYERKIVLELKELWGPDIWTSRNMSRQMDNWGVDIVGTDVPYHIQCKAVEGNIKYHNLIKGISDLLSDKPPIIFHKRKKTAKSEAGELVIMTKEEFYRLVALEGIKSSEKGVHIAKDEKASRNITRTSQH